MSAAFAARAVNFTGVLNWKKVLVRFWEEGFLSLPKCVPIKFPCYSASVCWSAQLSSPGRQGLWTAFMEHKDWKIRALHLELCFYVPSAESLMIPVAKGAFVTTESSLWCVVWETNSAGLANLHLLKSCHSCYLLCVGSGKGLRTSSKLKADPPCWARVN